MKQEKERIQDVVMQAFALFLLILMSVESLNPVKTLALCLGISPNYIGLALLALLLGLLYQHASDFFYFTLKIFFHSILSMFFKTIDIVGAENIPEDGPVIFTGNHANQFVDGMMVLMNCNRKVGFLVAEKSWNRPIIGDLMKIVGCIPVVRPQDSVIAGKGQVYMETTSVNETDDDKQVFVLHGQDTEFVNQISVGDQVRYQGESVKDSGVPVKVINIIDQNCLHLETPLCDHSGKQVDKAMNAKFGIFQKVDQSETFSQVYAHLKKGNCIGIFPEGGSHDRTDLLPLKAGVALMAYGVKDRYGITAAVVPVGLNYFRGHRFRARVVIEFGAPVHVEDEDMEKFRKDKREACNELLASIEQGMRSVIVTAPDYNILQLIYCARRLYQPTGIRLTPTARQDLNRRFAEGYKLLLTNSKKISNKNPLKDMEELRNRLEEYETTLNRMGLQDHQVPFLPWWGVSHVLSGLIYSVVIFSLASIPSLLLNAPVGLCARYVAKQEQKKALAGSNVKIAARDVMLSKKILFSLVAVPVLWISYFLLAIGLTSWKWSSIFLLFLSCPLFSYFGVRAVEAGIIEFKTIRPLFYRLLPKYRSIQDQLPLQRAQLQHIVRSFVNKYEEELGPLAQSAPMDWKAYLQSRKKLSMDDEVEENDKQEEVNEKIITKEHDLDFLQSATIESSLHSKQIEEDEEDNELDKKKKNN